MGMSTPLCHTKDIQAGRTPSADSLGHTLEANSLRSPWTLSALLNGSPWWTLAGQAGSHSTPLIPCEQIRSSPLAAETDCLPHPHPPLTALIIITCPGGEARGRVSDNSLAWDTVGSCQGPSPPLQREQDNAGQCQSGTFEAILCKKHCFHPQKGVPTGGDTLEIPKEGKTRKIGMPEVLRRKMRPAGGRMILQWNYSCSEGWEAALGSGMHTSADFEAAVQLWGPGSDFSSALSSSFGFTMASWSRYQPGKRNQKKNWECYYILIVTVLCSLSFKIQVHWNVLWLLLLSGTTCEILSTPLNLWVWQKCSGCNSSVCENQQLEVPQPCLAGGLSMMSWFFSRQSGNAITLPPAWRLMLTKKRSSIKAPNKSHVE